jgi:hypothetical protein
MSATRLLTATTIALSAVLAQASAQASAPSEGRYEGVNTVDVDVPFYVHMEGTKDGKYSVRLVRCWLIGGIDAIAAVCPDQQVSMPVSLHLAGEYTSILAVDYLALELWAVTQDIDLAFIHSSNGVTWSAEAEWVDGRWVCNTSDTDADKCDKMCGLAGGSVSTTPEVPSNNPFAEPACTVTCDCNDSDSEYEWIDQPQVLASGA